METSAPLTRIINHIRISLPGHNRAQNTHIYTLNPLSSASHRTASSSHLDTPCTLYLSSLDMGSLTYLAREDGREV